MVLQAKLLSPLTAGHGHAPATSPDQPQSLCRLSSPVLSKGLCLLIIFMPDYMEMALAHKFPLDKASSWTAPGSETHTLPPSWPDSPGSTVMTSPSPITHHIYPLHSPAPFRALSSPLSFNQWPGFIFPVPSGVFAFPHVPPAQDANNPNPASSHQLTDPKTRTL
ncbi:uncharacterized protein LOC121637382 isoform X2 [Melanotaenia boesemani]|uniref:uncharacterized protein LOC121637382 isoform X2 n=1 Tax=Melanotaenia boesemani TaxID=1250792 RepID=UPI001C0599EA|nr:uncharacterized protein LOC121637382 isoform X2 [Melanotaenia boesemani]